MGAEPVAVDKHRDSRNDELSLECTEVESLHINLAAMTDFVEFLKGSMAAEKTSFSRDHEEHKARLTGTRSLPDAPVIEVTPHRTT